MGKMVQWVGHMLGDAVRQFAITIDGKRPHCHATGKDVATAAVKMQ